MYFRWRTICSYEFAFDKDMHCYGDSIFIQFDDMINTRVTLAIGEELKAGNTDMEYFTTTGQTNLEIKFPNSVFLALKQEQFKGHRPSYFSFKARLTRAPKCEDPPAGVTVGNVPIRDVALSSQGLEPGVSVVEVKEDNNKENSESMILGLDQDNLIILIAAGSGGLVLLILVCVCCCYYCQVKKQAEQISKILGQNNEENSSPIHG